MSPVSRTEFGRYDQQSPLNRPQTRQQEQSYQRNNILSQATITDFRKLELVLNDMDGLFNLSSNVGLEMFKLRDKRRRLLILVEDPALLRTPATFQRALPAALGRFSAP